MFPYILKCEVLSLSQYLFLSQFFYQLGVIGRQAFFKINFYITKIFKDLYRSKACRGIEDASPLPPLMSTDLEESILSAEFVLFCSIEKNKIVAIGKRCTVDYMGR